MAENNNFEVKGLGTKSVRHYCKNIAHKKTGDPQKKYDLYFWFHSSINLLIIYCHGKLRN